MRLMLETAGRVLFGLERAVYAVMLAMAIGVPPLVYSRTHSIGFGRSNLRAPRRTSRSGESRRDG